MKDFGMIVGMFFRHLIDYPFAVIDDFIWFKLNRRPEWLRARRTKKFDRLEQDKIRVRHAADRLRFYIKSQTRK